jgi:multidrug efflux system membrane fusion protein
MNLRHSLVLVGLGFTLAGAVTGCAQHPDDVAPPQAPVVPISQPIQRMVTDYVDFTGRTDAVNSVSIVPRVTGYLIKMPFKEGSFVKKDDLLFEIDPRPYKAQLDQAEGQVGLYQAQLTYARKNLARANQLNKPPVAISAEELDQAQAAVQQAEASLKAAKASLEVYKLNLSFCRVTSPIDGVVGRYFFTVGNLVNQDQTQLTTVVSVDPMYAYFDMDEPTLLQVRQAMAEGKIHLTGRDTFRVFMGLQGETGYPHQGTINFINNQVNPGTGSITVRGVFPNTALKNDVGVLSPGMFVRVHLPIGQPHPGLLVIDRAIGSDQGLKYVYVIDAKNKATYRRITTGPLQPDGLRVITDGLKPGDWVAVGALQQIRPNLRVQTERIAMPTFGQAKDDKATTKTDKVTR